MRTGFFQFAVWYILFFVVGCSILSANQDAYVYFERTIQYWDFFPEVKDVVHIRPKTLSLKTSDETWNHHFWDATKRVTKLKTGKEAGLIEGTFVMFQRYSGQDVLIPMVARIEWYKKRQLQKNYISEFQKKIKKTLTKKNRSRNTGKSIDLVNASVAGMNVALKIKGNISVDGQIIFEDKEQVNTNMNQNKSWDLDIEQTQRFDIEGTIGERWTIEVEQDSEADFDWENNMFLKYKGEKNDIFQKAEAGNISLNLPSTKFVSVGSGKSEGLFGLKAEYQLGPLAIQTILSREQVRKASKSMSGGETSNSFNINDYNFIKDRYFFIEEKFKNQFYPLNEQNRHVFDNNYVIGEYKVYKKVFSIEEGVVAGGIAYVDPVDPESYSVSGSWKLLTQGQDYVIDALVGTIRLNSISSIDAVGIAYTIAEYDSDSLTFSPTADLTFTDVNYSYDICNPETECNEDSPIEDYIEGNEIEGFQLSQMSLKLIKDGSTTTPNSKTWPLMFKNVYSLGASNIDPSGLEISIVHDRGGSQEDTHSQTTGKSYINAFKLDSENENNQFVEDGDGKIDLYGSLLSLKYGELFLPTHLPFAYDETPRENSDGAVYDQFGNLESAGNYSGPDYWGNNAQEVKAILNPHLNDADNNFIDELDDGPAMYYSTNQSEITSEHQFLIKVNHSSRGSSMSLGFMIVEGSETVTLNGRQLEKGIDYNIDYFSGTLNFLIPEATDPTARIEVSYEENELISFDQKLLTGTHLKYEFGERNFLSGGAFFYKQSISEKKVDIGYEPMQNFIWNINGKIEKDMDFLTAAVDRLPFIETSKLSKFRIEGEYAEVYPNPNPLGQAFLDDFESSKRTTSPSIMQRQWKMSSPPVNDDLSFTPDNENRGSFAWFNPYYDINTKEIWPNQSTSSQANNTTTKTLSLQTQFNNIGENGKGWNGITTIMYSSDFDQSQSKYLDIWLNADSVHVNDNLILHIDIGSISEDLDNDGFLDTEDDDIYGGGMGDNILNDEEDTGLDGCFDEQEDGFGGCLPFGYTYENPPTPEDINSSDYIDVNDPNGDNWSYTEGSNDYSHINGLEGNGKAMGSRYPDTEDLDKDYSLDSVNDYFTMSIQPKDNTSSSFVTETENSEGLTGWKLFRLPLSKFEEQGEKLVEWTDVRNMRLWVESEIFESSDENSILKIAKLEIVGNQWEELGEINSDSLFISEFTIDPTFTIEVINTDENPEYSMPTGVIQETDSYSGITLKEQSLVMSFIENQDCDIADDSDCNLGGINKDNIFAIEKNLTLLTGDKKNSFFVYENLEMYVFGGDPSPGESWPSNGDVDILFRIGRDDNFYEIRQPIYPEWDSRNHIKLNLDKLSFKKLVIHQIEDYEDTGIDSVFSVMENGCGGGLPEFIRPYYTFSQIISELTIDYENLDSQLIILDSLQVLDELFQIKDENENFVICGGNTIEDPNGDDFSCGLDLLCDGDEGYSGSDEGEYLEGTEGNDSYDVGEEFIDDNLDGEYDDLSEEAQENLYDPLNELWTWKKSDGFDIEAVCNNCSELRVKGEPAIDNLKYIVVGVVNRSDESLFGKVLIDELRMTGVKSEKGKAFRLESSIDFADFLSINASYEKKDADFHMLQQRLGTGNNSESYNVTAKLNPNLFLPSKWGIKTPMNMTYSHSISSPKFRPGSDILAGSIEEADSSIQTINDKLTFSTSFNKSARSKNWWVKSTVDNITINFSAIGKRRSTSTIEKEESLDLSSSAKYSYNFGKENYYHIFKWMKKVPIIGDFLSESRFYYTPDKLSANISLNENDKISKQRNPFSIPTPTYSLKMQRDFTLNYKFTKSFQVNYTKNISSNLDDYKEHKYDIVKNLSPGLIKNVKEKFTTTFSPDFLGWLDPKITYNPSYTWDYKSQGEIQDTLGNIYSVSLANINVSAPFKTTMNITPKEIVELFYTPESKSGSSSRSRSRSRGRKSSSKKSTKIYEFKNPVMKYFLGKSHSLFSIATKLKLNYEHSETHKLNNILASDSPDYLYKFGFISTPSNLTYNNDAGTYSFTHKRDDKFTASTSLNITSKFQISKIEYKNNISRTTSSTSTPQLTVNTSRSFLPLGMNGDDGFPFVNWNVNWSGFEKWWILDNYFKTISLSHSYSNDRSTTENGGDWITKTYTQSLSPLIGISMKTKGKNKWSLNFTVSHNETINRSRTGTPTTRIYKNKINGSISHNRTGGLNIPLFFFRDFYISNDMNFDLNVSWNQDYKLIDPGNAASIDDFNEDERSFSLDIKPNVTYSFTRWVNGNFYFVYKVSENKNTGRTEEKDFGFKVNIRIQG